MNTTDDDYPRPSVLNVATIVMAVPLLLSPLLKRWPFGPGYPSVVLYSLIFVSIIVVPPLLLVEVSLVVWRIKRRNQPWLASLWHLGAIAVAILSLASSLVASVLR